MFKDEDDTFLLKQEGGDDDDAEENIYIWYPRKIIMQYFCDMICETSVELIRQLSSPYYLYLCVHKKKTLLVCSKFYKMIFVCFISI